MDKIIGMANQASGLFGGIANMFDIGGNRRRKKQIEQQQKLTDMQVDANKQLADYGMGIQKEMFDYTGYGAQRKQMEAAGLNPALMYGHAGQGGSTGQGGAGSAGMGMAADEAAMMNAQTNRSQLALQQRRQQAEIENIEANTANIKKTTEETEANIESITQQVENTKVQRAGMILQNNYDEIRNEIASETKELDIRNVMFDVKRNAREIEKIVAEINGMNMDIEIKDKTKEKIIESYELNNNNIAADILLKQSGAALNRTQAETMIRQLGINLSQLGVNMDKNTIEKEFNQILRDNNITTVGGNAINSIATMVLGGLMLKGGGAKKIRGFVK